jgi:hypothetical protein
VNTTLAFSAITVLDAGAGTDTINGVNTGSTWSITGTNSGTVDALAFSNVENITGGTGADNYSGVLAGSLSGTLTDLGGTSQIQGVLRAGTITFGAVGLAADTVLNTSSANGIVTLGAVTGNNRTLRVSTGTGLKNFLGPVNGLSSATLAPLVLEGTGTADFADAVTTIAGGIDASTAGTVVFRGPVTLGNGLVGSTFAGPVQFNAAAPVTFSGFDGLTFSGGIVATGADVTVNSQGGNISLFGLDAGGRSITLNAGTGTVDLLGQNITNLNQLSLTAALSRLASVTGTGTQAYHSALLVSGTLTAARLDFSGTGDVTAADGISSALAATAQIVLDKGGSGTVRLANNQTVTVSSSSALTALNLNVTTGTLNLTSGIQASSRIDLSVASGNLTQTTGSLVAPLITLNVSGTTGTAPAPVRTAAGTLLTLNLGGNAFLVESSRTQLGTGILYTGGAASQTIDLTLSGGNAQLAANFGDTGDDFIIRVTAGALQQSAGRLSAGELTVTATGAIGASGNPLLTRADRLDLTSGGAFGTFVSDIDAVEYQGGAATGPISVTAQNTLTVSGNISTTGSVLLRSTTGNIEGSNVTFPIISADTLQLDTPLGSIIFNNLALVLNQGLGSAGATVDLGNIQIAGDLVITTTGPVTQTGALVVGGTFTVNALGQSVTLNNAGNRFGTLRVRSGSLSLTEFDATVIGLLEVAGAASLGSGGSITQTGAITAASLALSAAQGIVLEDLGNQIATLGNVVRGGAFRFFTQGNLAINGDISGGSLGNDVDIRAANNLTLLPGARIAASGADNDVILAALGGNFTDASGAANSLDPAAGSRFVIYSGNRIQTDTGLLIVNFIQLSSPYPTAPSGAGNALLVREGVPGDTTIVIVIPFNPIGNIGGLNVGDFGLRTIDAGISTIGLGLRGGRGGTGGFGLFALNDKGEAQEISEDAAEALRELRRTLKEDMSEAAKDEILQALADILSGRLDPREVRLPPGLVYQEDSFGNSVIVPPELADEFLLSILDPATHDVLMRALSPPNDKP